MLPDLWVTSLHWAVCETSHLPVLTNSQSESREEGASTRQGSGTTSRHSRGLKNDKLAHISHILFFVEDRRSLFRKKKVSFNTPLSWWSYIWKSVAAWPDHQFKERAEVTFLDIMIEQQGKKKLVLFLHLEIKIDQPLWLVYYRMWYFLLRHTLKNFFYPLSLGIFLGKYLQWKCYLFSKLLFHNKSKASAITFLSSISMALFYHLAGGLLTFSHWIVLCVVKWSS